MRPEAESVSFVVGAGLEDRFEDLVFAAFDRGIVGFGGGMVGGIGVGLDFEGRGQFLAGAGGRVVDEGLGEDGGAGEHFVKAGGAFFFGAAGRVACGAFGEAFGAVAFFGGEAPEGQLGGGERGELGDVLDGEAEAIVGGGANRDWNRDRDIEDRDDEGKAGCFFGLGDNMKIGAVPSR